MNKKYNKVIATRVSEKHLNMLHELKEKYYVNISQFMRNTIEQEYEKQLKNKK